jgi:hypothetical protein
MEYYKNCSVLDLPGEIWKDVLGYDGLYMVSNLGRVKSLGHLIPTKGESLRQSKTRIIKQKLKKNGYLEIMLSKNGIKRIFLVHRLVAFAFLDYPQAPRNIVNHKDENPKNNTIENLEWVTHRENVNYGTAIERTRQHLINHPKTSRPVVAIASSGDEFRFPSVSEAARFMGCSPLRISYLCRGKGRYRDDKYTWKYES